MFSRKDIIFSSSSSYAPCREVTLLDYLGDDNMFDSMENDIKGIHGIFYFYEKREVCTRYFVEFFEILLHFESEDGTNCRSTILR